MSHLFKCVILFIMLCTTAAREFKVGDHFGWRVPDPTDTSFYTRWAERNRFQVGDSLVFEYENDSVLSVEEWDYFHCDASNPITAFDNGKSILNLDSPGAFYFISGTAHHCSRGQKLLVEVMSPQHHPVPVPVPESPPPSLLAPQGISLSPMSPSPEAFSPVASSPYDSIAEDSTSIMLSNSAVMAPFATFLVVLLLAL
ncbi:hypothetical protein HN51_042614 [Arachis hypogaea]|uniref:early nodulin-like protein 1 n=1 Tax=Arachis ipaensis TaxID=130454 RepID=UPI000A2B2CAA|nr:early nodulin-like protein 1 [Arachis ipaensis]